MTDKVLYRDDFNAEEILAIGKYMIARLSDSATFNSKVGYWYNQSKYKDHFVLTETSYKLRLQIAENAIKVFIKDFADLYKYFDVSVLYDNFNTDLVFEIRKDVDLTYIYGLARMTI